MKQHTTKTTTKTTTRRDDFTVLKPVKIGRGYYQIANDYIVAKTPDGWRWHDKRNASTGGEWRSTRLEALLDLEAFVSIDR